MSPEEKKKPEIEYEISDDGNVIEACIDDKTSFVWEAGYGVMPQSVWDEKRKQGILEIAKNTISTATSTRVESISVKTSVMVVLWSRYENCGAPMQPNSEFCFNCVSPVG